MDHERLTDLARGRVKLPGGQALNHLFGKPTGTVRGLVFHRNPTNPEQDSGRTEEFVEYVI